MAAIKNYMEDCVIDLLNKVFKNLDCCSCDECKLDIMAIVLNNLPPKYVVTHKGGLYVKLSHLHRQFEVDILSEIAKAAVIVSANPRHHDTDDTEV